MRNRNLFIPQEPYSCMVRFFKKHNILIEKSRVRPEFKYTPPTRLCLFLHMRLSDLVDRINAAAIAAAIKHGPSGLFGIGVANEAKMSLLKSENPKVKGPAGVSVVDIRKTAESISYGLSNAPADVRKKYLEEASEILEALSKEYAGKSK